MRAGDGVEISQITDWLYISAEPRAVDNVTAKRCHQAGEAGGRIRN